MISLQVGLAGQSVCGDGEVGEIGEDTGGCSIPGRWQDCAISAEGVGPLPMGDREIGKP